MSNGAVSAAIAEVRQRRAAAAEKYEEKTAGLLFTKDFNTSLEAVMNDPLATHGQRYLAWLKRYSWGQYSLYAIGADGEPRNQAEAAKDLHLDKTIVSKVVNYYEKRGIVRRDGKKQYPVIDPPTAPNPQKVGRSSNFSEFLNSWKVAHSTDFSELEVARSTVNRIRKVILSDYRQLLRAETNAGPSLYKTLQTLEKTSEERLDTENQSSGGRACSGVVEKPASPPARPVEVPHTKNPPSRESPAPPEWHARLRGILKGLPIGTHLDEPMFQRIASHLSAELLDQFETAAKAATGIRKWPGYEDIARQVAARGVVNAAAAATGGGPERRGMSQAMQEAYARMEAQRAGRGGKP